MYMSCVPYVMYGFVFVENFALALLRICMTKSKVDVAIKFAMAVLLMCKTKTLRQHFGVCTSNVVCVCLMRHM